MTTWNDVKNEDNYIKVLDHGFVGLIDSMGSDEAISKAARLSYGKGTRAVSQDKALIRYLVKHEHNSPIEMGVLKFHIRVPIFVDRQITRHRMHSKNELSLRYSEASDDFYLPELENIQPQSLDNKQGREGTIDIETKQKIQDLMGQQQAASFQLYTELLGNYDAEDEGKEHVLGDDFGGIAREIARNVLPVTTYTEYVWKQDLRNLLHLVRLRTDPHAQYETRVAAQAMYDLIQPLFPITIQAFEDYIKNAVKLSSMEFGIIGKIIEKSSDFKNIFNEMVESAGGVSEFCKLENLSKREYTEFCKLLKI